jgi:simple sugar transport system ATP-binding protein/ribose transport system ATP-binding protein
VTVRLELRGIGKRFGGVQALSAIDLTIQPGTIHALVGENGAGKSTLGKIIAGVHRPDEGEIRVDGDRVDYRSPRAALRRGVAVITQEGALVPHRSVLENVFLGIESASAGFVKGRSIRRRYSTLLEEVHIDLPPAALVSSLSLSDRKKVEVLRAVARSAQVVVMDEPTAASTTDEAEQLFGIVRLLHERGTTVVYVSHFLPEVLKLSDTVTVLRDGKVVRTSASADESPEGLVSAMLGRTIELTFPEKSEPAPDAPVVLSVRDLRRPPAVNGVSFEIRAGEILGLAGLIGSGRSELARAVFGADRRERGDVQLLGRGLRLRSPRDAISRGLVLLPEDRKRQGLLMKRSVADNITLPYMRMLSNAGFVSERRTRRSARTLMERVDVRATGPRAPVSTLSGGNQQKVLFARLLFRPPRVFIADEPTRGVDVGAKRAIYELIRTLAADGAAVLLISSEYEEVLGLAHRVLVMREGRFVAELVDETMNEDALLHAAFGTVEAGSGS